MSTRARRLPPLFSYYGSKWLAAPRYPAPAHDLVVEPFAGSACYSLLHCDRRVLLLDVSDYVVGVWRYLLRAPASEVAALPLLAPGQSVDDLPVCQEARWLIGFWANQSHAQPAKRLSSWGRGIKARHYWGERVRARLAASVDRARHWQVRQADYREAPDARATWFVDPPYQRMGRHYPHGSDAIDFVELGAWCRARRGRVVVCEQEGADWLPFWRFGNLRSARGKGATSREVVYASDGPAPHVVRWDRDAAAFRLLPDDRAPLAEGVLVADEDELRARHGLHAVRLDEASGRVRLGRLAA